MALGAHVTLRSRGGERVIPLHDFYTGVRGTVMRTDEVLTDISFPAVGGKTRSGFVKLALRRAQAISVVNVAAVVAVDGSQVTHAAITLGSVAPTIVHAEAAEAHLVGKPLRPEVMLETAGLAVKSARPIDDLRGSADYRREMIRVCTLRALKSVSGGKRQDGIPDEPVMLWGREEWHWRRPLGSTLLHRRGDAIRTTINGKAYAFERGQDKTLLRLLREEAGLTGTKEGCAEGECGACTVFLDGMAVMSCLVPAPRAHGAEIVTVEGLAQEGTLHPMQQAFIDEGAVQCGYCTPGFLMSGVKLLEERTHPSGDEIRQSMTGNLCRCTGYYKIISAFERAAQMAEE
jgi:carbon-monoxide dehydrogenase medium subunit